MPKFTRVSSVTMMDEACSLISVTVDAENEPERILMTKIVNSESSTAYTSVHHHIQHSDRIACRSKHDSI